MEKVVGLLDSAVPTVVTRIILEYIQSQYLLLGGGQLSAADGKHSGGRVLAEVELLDLGTQQWKLLAPMLTARRLHTMTQVADAIFAVGGIDSDGAVLNTVERFDLFENAWTRVASMTHARFSHACMEHKGHLYVFGGSSERKMDSVERYDPLEEKWRAVASMPQPVTCHSVLRSSQHKMLVLGFSVLMEFDASTETWADRTHSNMLVWQGVLKPGYALTQDMTSLCVMMHQNDQLSAWEPAACGFTTLQQVTHSKNQADRVVGENAAACAGKDGCFYFIC